jgi:integrase
MCPYVKCAADLVAAPVRWLWDGWLPAAKVVLLDGDPGTGKSLLTCELAARLSRGELGGGPAASLLLNAEDGPGDTLRPRLEAAGADLGHLDLRGPHDLRHTFATWLEDAAIPSRVIDELMGHASGRRDRGAGGSPMGRVYRETTPAMVARVTAALDERMGRALAVAAYLLREGRDSRAVDGGAGL